MAKYDVYISYGRMGKPVADKIRNLLISFGLRVWDDRQNLLPGYDWTGQMIRAIELSSNYIVILGDHDSDSDQISDFEAGAIRNNVAHRPYKKLFLISLYMDDGISRELGDPFFSLFPYSYPRHRLNMFQNYKNWSPSEFDMIMGKIISTFNIEGTPDFEYPKQTQKNGEQIIPQLDEISNQVDKLDEIQQSIIQNLILKISKQDSRINENEELTEKLFEHNKLFPRVGMPPQEIMDIKLIPTHTLDRFELDNQDLNETNQYIGIIIGALIGIFTNILLSEPITFSRESIVLLSVLGIGLVIFYLRRRKLAERVKSNRGTFLDYEPDRYLHDMVSTFSEPTGESTVSHIKE